MKSSTSNIAKTTCIGLKFIAIAPLLPVIALMHLTAWLCEDPVEGLEPSQRPVQPVVFGLVTGLPLAS